MRRAVSRLTKQSLKTFSEYGLTAPVRPLCHLLFRQQTWQEIMNIAAVTGLYMWESRIRFPSLASARRHMQASHAEPLATMGGRYASPVASTAHAMRANLLASATPATL